MFVIQITISITNDAFQGGTCEVTSEQTNVWEFSDQERLEPLWNTGVCGNANVQ